MDGIFKMEEVMTMEKILTIVGALLIVISVFLTYMTLDGGSDMEDDSVTGMDSDLRDDIAVNPIITLIFGIICLVAGVIDRNFLEGYMPLVVIVVALIALITVGLNIMDVMDEASDFNDLAEIVGSDAEMGVGIGLYIGLIGGILAIVGGALCWMKKD